MNESKLAVASITSFTLSLAEFNEMLTALALVISSLSGLLAVMKHFRQSIKDKAAKTDDTQPQ